MIRWRDFFQKLLNGEEEQEQAEEPDPRLLDKSGSKENTPPTLEEVMRQIGRLKNNKSPGRDNILQS